MTLCSRDTLRALMRPVIERLTPAADPRQNAGLWRALDELPQGRAAAQVKALRLFLAAVEIHRPKDPTRLFSGAGAPVPESTGMIRLGANDAAMISYTTGREIQAQLLRLPLP